MPTPRTRKSPAVQYIIINYKVKEPPKWTRTLVKATFLPKKMVCIRGCIFYLLLISFCSLIVTFCSLFVTVCSLLVAFARCLLLFARCLLLFARCLLLLARCSLLFCPNYCEINNCEPQKNVLTITKRPRQYFLAKFLRFWQLFLDGGFQSFLNIQNHFQSWHKATNIAWIDITLTSLLQYLNTF